MVAGLSADKTWSQDISYRKYRTRLRVCSLEVPCSGVEGVFLWTRYLLVPGLRVCFLRWDLVAWWLPPCCSKLAHSAVCGT